MHSLGLCLCLCLCPKTNSLKTKHLSMLLSVQMRLMGECRGSIDAVKRAEGELTEDEDDMPGLTNPTSTDTQGKGQ